jgi:hypothetical protein
MKKAGTSPSPGAIREDAIAPYGLILFPSDHGHERHPGRPWFDKLDPRRTKARLENHLLILVCFPNCYS